MHTCIGVAETIDSSYLLQLKQPRVGVESAGRACSCSWFFVAHSFVCLYMLTLTRTSPALGGATSTVSSDNGSLGAQATAARQLITCVRRTGKVEGFRVSVPSRNRSDKHVHVRDHYGMQAYTAQHNTTRKALQERLGL